LADFVGSPARPVQSMIRAKTLSSGFFAPRRDPDLQASGGLVDVKHPARDDQRLREGVGMLDHHGFVGLASPLEEVGDVEFPGRAALHADQGGLCESYL
jgi:hypothetical protein